jgi:type I restriction enzyme S subunit
VSRDVLDKHRQRYRLHANDIIFGRIGTIGEPRMLPSDGDYCLSANVVLIQPLAEPRFVLSWLKSDSALRQVRHQLHTTSQPAFGLQRIRNLQVQLPPLPEQREIAQILTAWDEAIALVERRLAAARARKRGLAQRLLTGQVRFAGFTEPWREVKLGELGRVIRGVSHKPEALRSSDGDDAVRLLRANNLVTDGLVFTDTQIVPRARASANQVLRPGDIAGCMSSGSLEIVGKASAFKVPDGHPYVVGAFCAPFKPHKLEDAPFCDQFFQSDDYRRAVLVISAGTNI